MPEVTPNKRNKEKLPSWWATSDIDSHLVVLDSVIFFFNKALHHGCLQFLEHLDIIDFIDKNVLNIFSEYTVTAAFLLHKSMVLHT